MVLNVLQREKFRFLLRTKSRDQSQNNPAPCPSHQQSSTNIRGTSSSVQDKMHAQQLTVTIHTSSKSKILPLPRSSVFLLGTEMCPNVAKQVQRGSRFGVVSTSKSSNGRWKVSLDWTRLFRKRQRTLQYSTKQNMTKQSQLNAVESDRREWRR